MIRTSAGGGETRIALRMFRDVCFLIFLFMKKMNSEQMAITEGGDKVDCALAGAGLILGGVATIMFPPMGITAALLGIGANSVAIASIARACRHSNIQI